MFLQSDSTGKHQGPHGLLTSRKDCLEKSLLKPSTGLAVNIRRERAAACPTTRGQCCLHAGEVLVLALVTFPL